MYKWVETRKCLRVANLVVENATIIDFYVSITSYTIEEMIRCWRQKIAVVLGAGHTQLKML